MKWEKMFPLNSHWNASGGYLNSISDIKYIEMCKSDDDFQHNTKEEEVEKKQIYAGSL